MSYKDKYYKYKQKYIKLQNNQHLIMKIKNGITLTENNMLLFLENRDIIYDYAVLFNHGDIIKLLN